MIELFAQKLKERIDIDRYTNKPVPKFEEE